MTKDQTINLIKDMLDITLDLQLLYIKNFENNLEDLKNHFPSLLTINKDYFNNFLNFMTNTKEKNIYSIIDSVFANYIIICLDEKCKDYILLGPYMYIKNSDDILSECDEHNFTSDEIKSLKKYHRNLPILNKHKISNIIKTLLKNIYNKDCKFEFIEKNNLSNLKPKNNRTPNELITLLESQTLEKNSAIEYKLFLAVREGDKFLGSKCLDKLLPQRTINSNDFTSIREYKNKLIYYNALMKKAAEIEATPIVYLESLFNTNINNIESSNDFNELYNLVSHMIVDYCNAVVNYKLKNYSPLIRRTINYINLNLKNELSVQSLANLFYVSPTYLSRLFKKEVNASVIEYINKQKVRRSTFLLKDTDLPIHHISHMVGIDDLNYFSRLFKKYMNKTPSQYRKDNT
ncbi:MAG: helix-turn-helix transcriptional regulator [Peptostreptococcaceae bacterium]